MLKGDLLGLPFADGTFDLILCNHVIEHIPDDVGALRELARILKSDGLLLIGVPNEGCGLARLRNHVLQRSILTSTDHVHFYTADLLTERIRRAGLRPRGEIRREGFFVPHLRLAYIVREYRLGRAAMDALARLFPAQCAGLLLAAVHDGPK
jgi:SAM-dependent methyltransferase